MMTKDNSNDDGKDVVDQWWTSGRLEFIRTTFYNSLLLKCIFSHHIHTHVIIL